MTPSTRTHSKRQVALENARQSRSTRETPERSIASATNGTGSQSTPIRDSTHALQPPATIAKMKPALEAELEGAVIDIPVLNNQIFPSFADTHIPTFIARSPLYNNKTKSWTAVADAEQHTAERYLYTPFENIINAILLKFKGHGNEQRWVKDTHNIRMSHIEGRQIVDESLPGGRKKQVTLKSSPDLSILGHGLHLSGARGRPGTPNYGHCLCPVEIKTASNYNAKTVLLQAGIYARQCFIHQPYRRYVPIVVIVGSKVFLYIYDRSGVLRSGAINIHEDPDTFVRIILGVSTVGSDIRFSSFDPRVCFESKNDHPTVNVENRALNHNSKYKVTGVKFSRKTIRGRGTYCANAEFEDGGKVVTVLIKDAWRTLDKSPEYALLDDIKGLDGVGQILFYEDDRYTITDFRRHIFTTFCETNPYNLDRRFCRLVLKAYGRSICHFSTKLELLEAFHDALAGHKYLWQKGILHRDVSVDNILLGEPGAREGNRGILIDFDMAVRVDHISDTDKTRTGTRAFQSYALLKTSSWKKVPPQDHIDDLESYFYCLGWACVKYDGTPTHRSPEFLDHWEQGNADSCARNKLEFLTDPVSNLNSYFDTEVFHQLFQDLAKLSRDHVMAKIAIATSKHGNFPKLSEIYSATSQGQDHDKVIAVVKAAIEAQKEEPREEKCSAESDTEYPVSQEYGEFSRTSPPSTGEMTRPGMKRPNPNLSDEGDRVSSSKRVRTQSSGEKPSGSQSKALERQLTSGSQRKPSKSQRRGSGKQRSGK